MIPPTVNGLPAMSCISAMQKCIRRGLERQAMEFAAEMLHTSKAFCTMVCNRLEIISHEDIDTQSQPHIVPFVATACDQARRLYKSSPKGESANPSASRLAVGNAIRMMCRATKSREGDHFQAAIGQQALLNGYVPEVPEWAHDMHTMKGKRMGRGIDHFLSEGTQLFPEAEADQYQDEAHDIWRQLHST
jgi:replication-associated recombination protein RarA